MGERAKKEEIITFKVDQELADALAGVRNRSAFIREAILSALGNACPFCDGTGTLSVAQMRHWRALMLHHHMEECETCHEMYLVCDLEQAHTAQ